MARCFASSFKVTSARGSRHKLDLLLDPRTDDWDQGTCTPLVRRLYRRAISIVNDARLQTLLVSQFLPTEHEPAHVQIAQQRTDRRTLRSTPTFVPIVRASTLVPTFVCFLDRGLEPHLDQMEHGSVDNSTSYRS